LSAKGAPGRWKNVALTVYLICPLALVTVLCVWIWISLQQRVENAGRMREPLDQREAVPENEAIEPPSGDGAQGVIEKPAGNNEEGSDESGG
jgi:hypothetical protein